MAWLSSHVGADGATRYYLRRRGGVASEPLGAVTEEEAQRILRAVNAAPGAPRKVESTEDTLDAFYKSLAASKRSERTVAYYKEKLGAVVAALGARPLATWRRVDLEAYLAGKAAPDADGAPGWSASTVSKTVRACRTFIRWAKDNQLDVPDFTGGMRAPRGRPVESHAYSAEELTAILAASVGTALEVPVHLATYAGLPLGDLRALTWAEVDWKRSRILKRRVKTGERIDVPMADALKEVLKRHRATSGPVCRGLPDDDGHLYKMLGAVLRAAGIPSEDRHGWHGLRHSMATILGANGADVATIGALLGHRPGSPVTLRYIHASSDRKEAAIKGLAAALRAQA